MSRSDNTLRMKYREPGYKTHNRERLVGIGRGDTRALKRLAHKRNRKSLNPSTRMGPVGLFESNYRYMYAD